MKKMSRKNLWKEPLFEAMKERAILSSEMPSILNGLYRNVPSAVKISAVLCRDDRFVKLEKPYCYGLSGAKSHRVILFGLSDREYEDAPPFSFKRMRN
jgi:hypothetical protein